MNIIRFSIVSVMLAVGAVSGSAKYQLVKLDVPPSGSGVEQTYDEATNTYSIYVRENNFNDVLPTIAFAPLEAPLPSDLRTIAFEYMSDTPVGWEILRLEKIFTGKLSREFELYFSVAPSDKWQTMRIPVGAYRDLNTVRFGSKAGQIVKWTWRDLVTGATLKMRNIRYESEELPFKEITISEGSTVIEAEDFLLSAAGTGYKSRGVAPRLQEYHHPVNAGEFPIMAWTGYSVISGSKDDMDRIKQGYKWIAEGGFNLTPGLNFAGCNMAALYDGREVNGYYIDLLPDDVNVKLLIDPGSNPDDIAEWVPKYKDSPRLGGYYIRDEPSTDEHFIQMGEKARNILAHDDSRLLYGNLLSSYCFSSSNYDNSWDKHVHTYFNKTGISYLSWDIYPVHENLNTGEIFLLPDFFENLEIANRLCRYYDIPFWAFVHACKCTLYGGQEGNPMPKEEYMRLQAFGNLAYGAQGLAYYPYVTPAPWAENMNYGYGPIDYATGERTATWYYCQNINREVHALTWVFLGSELLNAGHTNNIPPKGCRKLTSAMLPAAVDAVTSDGSGVCVTTLQNGTNKFLMVLNSDVNNEQTVTIKKNAAVKRVLADGTTVQMSAGDLVEKLPVGGYVLLLVDENAQPITHYSKAGFSNIESVSYRTDADGIVFSSSSEANGGIYLPNMGTDRWENYSSFIPSDKNCVVTRQEAQDNWGSTCHYLVDVPQDMDVNISVRHSVPWEPYGQVVSKGAVPGFSYVVENEPELNWPMQYAASMTLAVDGEVITPANQPVRPVAPAVYDPDGVEFNRILADKSLWTSTAVDGKPSDVLYFWPKAGGDNTLSLQYNEKPDYVAVHLSAGQHKITVNSLSYPWHFDSLLITDTKTSGVDNVVSENDAALKATGVKGGILVEAAGAYTVYNLSGVAVADGAGSSMVDLPAGLYIVVSSKSSVKAVVR